MTRPAQTEPAPPFRYRTRVWDLPTRLFHWALLACIVGLFITVNIGGDWMQWHFRLGYAVLTLLLFRVVWGFVGGRWSRFASFAYAPSTVLAYFQGRSKPEHSVGHNPIGAGSVFALLGFLLLQVATGLFSDDDASNQGPLTKFVSNARVSLATWYHKEVGSKVLIALIALHIVAVLFYLYRKKENLVQPMLHGDKHLPYRAEPSRDDAASRGVAAVLLALCAGGVWCVVRLGN
ncbi:MAG: cytochrome b/b6 domain-containing protein [Burkholderiaceae bacterium]